MPKPEPAARPAWILPNSVPGFGHGVGIVRGGLPARGLRNPIPGALFPLLYAARDGRLEIVRTLVAAKADVNQVDANGITPLIAAITNNHVDVARFLIDHGADIKASDWYGRTPLWAAVETRNMDVDNATFENSIDRKPFLELIQVLLKQGADPNVRMKEVPPIRRQFLRTTGSLSWVDFTGQTPFLTASLAGDLTVMRLLLEHGADPHIPTFAGTTALMAAAGVNWVFDQTYDEGPKALLEAVAAVHRARDGRECRQLDGADGAPRRRQQGIGRHHPVPRGQGREARRQGQGRPHAVDLGRGRLPGHTSCEAQTKLDRADSNDERERKMIAKTASSLARRLRLVRRDDRGVLIPARCAQARGRRVARSGVSQAGTALRVTTSS